MSLERKLGSDLLTDFNRRCGLLDEWLTSFFDRMFSKEIYVPHTFFGVIEKLKRLDGFFIATHLKVLSDEGRLNEIIQSLCEGEGNRSQYLFRDGKIALDRRQESSSFYDADREIDISELKEMSDLTYFSFLNAHNLPYLRPVETKAKGAEEDVTPFIDRSAFEHFMRDFLNKLKDFQRPSDESALRFNLLGDSFQYLAISVISWTQALYMTVEIMKNFFALYYSNIEGGLPKEFPMSGKITFFDQFVASRVEFLKTQNVSEGVGACRDFLRMDFMGVMRRSKEEQELSELQLFDNMLLQFDAFICAMRRQVDMGISFFRESEAQATLPPEGVDFCHACINFQLGFQSLLDELSKKDGVYRLTVHEARKALNNIYLDKYPYGEPDPKPSSGSSTPRTGATTPRLPFSPRASGANSPRRQLTVSSSPTGSPRSAATKAEIIGMWKRKSTGGEALSGGSAPGTRQRSHSLTRSSGGK